MNASTLSRRRFLRQAALAASFTLVPRHVLGGVRFVPPSETVNVAVVGAGGQGFSNVKSLFKLPDVQIMAVADAASSFSLADFYYGGFGGREPVRQAAEKQYGATKPGFRCAAYEDFREMLEKEKSIDAILCATPDHLHAYVTVASMRLGKHVYCEKPLTHNLWEARLVAKVAKETGVATQMGNIGHAAEGMRMTCEWLWDGAIGTVREAHAWVGATRWNKTLTGKPSGSPPVPEGLNWDLWLGPREMRPYHPAYAPVQWRDFWSFGAGGIGDFGCHDLDAACWALDLKDPVSVEFLPAGQMDAEIVPHGEIGYFEFAARGKFGPLKVTWYDGGLRPPRPPGMAEDDPMPGRGVYFVGEKGVLLSPDLGGRPRLLPDSLMESYKPPAKTLPRSKGHHRDWVDAIKGGAPAGSNFEYGARLVELPLLGALSLRMGKRLQWDGPNLKATNAPGAERFIKESYRPGWEPS